MSDPLTLTVPSPWGLALVLGLIDRWHHHLPAPTGLVFPVPLVIVQERVGNDYEGALNQIDRLARRRGLGPLLNIIPWQYALAGMVGAAMLTGCNYGWRERHGLAVGWRWDILHPMPAWRAEAA